MLLLVRHQHPIAGGLMVGHKQWILLDRVAKGGVRSACVFVVGSVVCIVLLIVSRSLSLV